MKLSSLFDCLEGLATAGPPEPIEHRFTDPEVKGVIIMISYHPIQLLLTV